jgi:hypothetical protein
VAGKRCGVGHDDLIPQGAIVRDVRANHEKILISNPRVPSSALRSAMDVDVLTECVAFADRQKGLFAAVFEILWLNADHAERKKAIVTVDRCRPFDDDMGIEHTSVPDTHLFANPAERSNGHILSEACKTMNDSSRVNHERCSESRLEADRREQSCLGSKFLADPDFPAHFPDDSFPPQDRNHNFQLIAGNDGPAETRLIDPHEVDNGVLYIFRLAVQEAQNRSRLGHGFDREHAGHDGRSGEMALKERLIDRDILYGDQPPVSFDFDNSVDQEKRVPVRKNP